MTRLEERRSRVGSLLNAYYRIDATTKFGGSPEQFESNLDAQGFDAQQYFDSTVSSRDMVAVRERAKELDAEVQDLDAEMKMLVYENYNKVSLAAGVIKQMSFCIDGLEPDMAELQETITRLSACQCRVEDGVSGKATQIDGLLKQQRVCRKLQVLFALPATLKRCLDHGHYGQAVEAYCSCSDFLRQYKHVPTFGKVLQEVEHSMLQIASALETRLRAPYLSVDEAVNSSVTLLDMGTDRATVAREYINGRTAVLHKDLERCFDPEPLAGFGYGHGGPAEKLTKDQQDLQRPESMALHGACWRAAELYVPQLCDAVEGFQKLQEGRAAADEDATVQEGRAAADEHMLTDFAGARIEELCERFLRLIDQNCPPTRVLVSCVHMLRDGLRRLHISMPTLLNKIFMDFLGRTALCRLRKVFASASAAAVRELLGLHSECKRLQECANSGLDDVLEQIAKTEQAVVMRHFTVLTDCQPLLSLLGFERIACQQLVRELREELVALSLTFVEVCHRYIGEDPLIGRQADPELDALPRSRPPELETVDKLEWSGLFALALVRIGRHLEMKALNKIWNVASDLFAEGVGGPLAMEVLAPHQPSVRAARAAAQGVITHYVLVSGQRLAQFFRNFVQNKNWMTVREPRSPSPFVSQILAKEVHAFDAQLARILGDPRRPRPPERRPLRHEKTDMELELERLVVRKLSVFEPIPFNRNGAVVGIMRIAFKALFEYMREETFAKFGVQQIQVDTAFLGEVIRDFVEMKDSGALENLLDEAVVSAKERCEGAVLMDVAVVEALVAEKKGRGGAEQA